MSVDLSIGFCIVHSLTFLKTVAGSIKLWMYILKIYINQNNLY